MTMEQKRRPVVSAFESREHADRALGGLREAGFKEDEVGWAMRHEEAPEGAKDVSKDVASGATAGAVTGGVLGGLGAAAGMALIPGIGPFIAGGYLATILTTAGASAAAGGLLGGLAGLGADKEEAEFYDQEFKSGRPIMTVNGGERDAEANEIFRKSGGYDYQSRRGGTGASGTTATTTPAAGGTGTTATLSGGTGTTPATGERIVITAGDDTSGHTQTTTGTATTGTTTTGTTTGHTGTTHTTNT